MKFGHFDDANKEYVITDPKTPYPWINYLGTQEFFSLISNTAGGYHFFKDARLRSKGRRYNMVARLEPCEDGARQILLPSRNGLYNNKRRKKRRLCRGNLLRSSGL